MYFIFVGFDYLGIGSEYVFLKDFGRVEYYVIIDKEVFDVFVVIFCFEGIIFVFEMFYVLVYLWKFCFGFFNGIKVVFNCSGRGDKDVNIVVKFLDISGEVDG